jgi:hypothetical protein
VPCPEGRNDSTVHLSQGELMLCRHCEEFRFPTVKRTAAAKKKDLTAISRLETGQRIGSTSSTSMADADIAATPTVLHVINELLTYAAYYRNRANGDALRRVMLALLHAC